MELHASLFVALLTALLAPVVLAQDIVSLTLSTNSTANCDMGLTHSGVFLLVEYRLTDSPWKHLEYIILTYSPGLSLIYRSTV